LGLDPGFEPKTKIKTEFNSIHFGIEINKRLKFLTPMGEKYWKIFLSFKKVRNFEKQTFFGVKNCKCLLISIPKCIELNSELILVLGMGSHPGPRPNIYFFWGKSLAITHKKIHY